VTREQVVREAVEAMVNLIKEETDIEVLGSATDEQLLQAISYEGSKSSLEDVKLRIKVTLEMIEHVRRFR
jgi:hypothetical protein